MKEYKVWNICSLIIIVPKDIDETTLSQIFRIEIKSRTTKFYLYNAYLYMPSDMIKERIIKVTWFLGLISWMVSDTGTAYK
ncbi:MAG: hypothetical protein ACI9UT_000428 [Flavobacteriales bacterium]|jgi:hypothetical protein